MNAFTILTRCRNAEDELAHMQQRIERRREAITSIHAQPLDPNGGGRAIGGDHDRIGRVVAEIADIEQEIERRKDALELERIIATTVIDDLNDLEGKVIYSFYVKHESGTALARRLKYSDVYIRNLKSKACRKLQAVSVDAMLEPWYKEYYGTDD